MFIATMKQAAINNILRCVTIKLYLQKQMMGRKQTLKEWNADLFFLNFVV